MATRSKLFAAAGIAAPVVFTILVIAQELLQADYSRVGMPVSALAAWPLGWIQNLNFFAFGLLLIVFVVGLDRAVAPMSGGRAGIVLLVVSAIGALIAGWFPWIRLDGRPIATSEHIVGSAMHFVGASLGLIVFSRRLVADERWKDLAAYTLDSGIAMLMLFLASSFLAVGPGRPLHPWAGLVQRITVTVWFTLMIVLAVRLWRTAQQSRRGSSRDPL